MTPNDAVREVKYVDAHGEAQCITNPDHIKAAAGAFGLFGELKMNSKRDAIGEGCLMGV